MRREAPGHTKQGDKKKGALEVLLLSLYNHFIGREGVVSDSSENFGRLYLVLGQL
jgi:hypothetical protein